MLRLRVAAIVALFISQPGYAGSQPTLREQLFNFEQIALLAKTVENRLAEKRARAALIARVGLNPDLLPPGVTFSHTAIAIYSKIRTNDNRYLPGYAIYNLYQGTQRDGSSMLKQDYPIDYYAVSQSLKTGIVIPNDDLQRELIRMVASREFELLHNPKYSVISNPFNPIFQNCTEFVLDVVFAALYGTTNVRSLKAKITARFDPFPVDIPRSKLAFAARAMPDVSLDDHSGNIATTTFTSIARFLLHHHNAQDAFILEADPDTLHISEQPLILGTDISMVR